MQDSTVKNVHNDEKVTIYTTSDFMGDVVKYEGRIHESGRRKYAQYDSAPYVDITMKRKRKAIRIMKTYNPYILVVKGWDHPDAEDYLKVVHESADAVISKSRYLSFDERYKTDFDKIINDLIESKKIEVVEDFRNVNPYNMRRDGEI